jgi:serine/threonine-protein kinase
MAELAGTILDGLYRIDRPLGAGAMGVVYQGLHLRLQRPIAIKVLAAGQAADPERVQRFHREAIAAGRIGSPRIVEVLDLGRLPDGSPYLVMEYLSGRTLEQVLAGTPLLPVPRAAALLGQVLEGLAAAHAHGIVHRDVKPANVLVCSAGGAEEYVKLVDFGLSKVAAAGGGPALTQAGAQLGTPLYMAPEQVLGLPDVDGRADLWATGMMLFRALTGRTPYAAADAPSLFAAIVGTDPPPLRALRPDLPAELERIVSRALCRDRDRRWADATEFRAALLPFAQAGAAAAVGPTQALAKPAPATGRPAPGPPAAAVAGRPRASVGPARRSRLVWVTAGLAVAVAAGVAVGLVFGRRGSGARPDAAAEAAGPSGRPSGPDLSAPPVELRAVELVLEAADGGAAQLVFRGGGPAEPPGTVEAGPAEVSGAAPDGSESSLPDDEQRRFVAAEAQKNCRLAAESMAGRGSVEPGAFERLEAEAALAHGLSVERFAELRQQLGSDPAVQRRIEFLVHECVAGLTGWGTRTW